MSLQKLVVIAVVALLALIVVGMWAYPRYNVWQQGQRGEAELARAEQNRKIAVQEAQAKLESAKLNAQAAVEQAKGVAEANKIIADGLGGAEGYLRYLWVEKLAASGDREVIYVPTETGLPILEASRLRNPGN